MSSPVPPAAFARGVRRADAPARAHYGRVFDVAVCPWDDSLFATAGEDETARVWRDDGLGSGGGFVSHGVCRGHKDEVVRVAWHPTMRVLASGSADGAVAVWRVAQPGEERVANAHDPDEASVARVDVLSPHPGEVYGCTFVGDGSGGGPVLATAAGTDLRLWDLETATELACVGPMKHGVGGSDTSEKNKLNENKPDRWEHGYLFSLSSDGGTRNLLASACSDGTVKLWGCSSSARTATPTASIPNHPNALASATCFLPGGDLLASAGSDKTVVVTDVRMAHKPVRKITSPVVVMGLCAVPGGVRVVENNKNNQQGWLAMVGKDGLVRCVPGEGSSRMTALRQSDDTDTNASHPPTPLLCVAANADGTRVFAAGITREAAAETKPGEDGPFVLKGFGNGSFNAKKPEPAEIFIWEATSE